MLNYIWAGFIIFSLVFALVADVRDLTTDAYRNEQPLPLTVSFPEGYQAGVRRVPTNVLIDPATYGRFYATDARPDSAYGGYLVNTREGTQLRFEEGVSLPEPLGTIRGFSSSRDDELQGTVQNFRLAPDSLAATAEVVFTPVRFVKLNAITEAAFDFAEVAVELALGLIGVIALFLGLLRIAEAAGIINALVRFTQPVFRPLFPEIPDGHPAMGMIVLNLTANMLGLGNAATPLGIKAMEELQELNPSEDTASNAMVMLLAMNTASVQLVPPVLLVAIMGLQINQLIFAIIIVTMISLIVAVTSAKLLGRLPGYRKTDPDRLAREAPPPDAPAA